ncbi:MAG: elongation factor G [Deltaproteobacteria bacterium]
MATVAPELKRSLVFVSHAQAGKTSLIESLLFAAGATTRKGTIAEGNTVGDYNTDEIAKKNSINSSVMNAAWKGHVLQIVDTPGYADFIADMICALRAVDGAVVVVDATAGIEVGTERAWDKLEERKIPRLLFLNKMDKENIDLEAVLKEIRERFSRGACLVGSELSPELKEAIAETDDALLEQYLEGKEIDDAVFKKALRNAVLERKIFPVIKGSALTDAGVKDLLDAIVAYLPSPLEHPPVAGKDPESGEAKEAACSEEPPLCALVFKSISDPFVGQLTVLRIFAGKLDANTGFYNVSRGTKERVGNLMVLQGKEQRAVPSASCGDIVAVAKLRETLLGDSLSDGKASILLPPFILPEPVYSSSIKPKTRSDEEKISEALAKLCASDPTFRINRDAQTKELVITGMGDQHIGVMVNRLKERYHVEVDIGTPKVPYKETLKKSAKAQGKHKKQSGGRGQYGDVWLEVAPLERGKDFEFIDKIVGGAIPRNFIPSVEKGVRRAMVEGVITHFPMVDVAVTAYDGSYHDVDSSDIAFQIAGALAFRKAAMEAGPILLEPIMEIEVTVPEECVGAIPADLNSRRGRVLGVEARGKNQTIRALVPLAELFRYASDLRSMTGGRGSYTMHYIGYEEVPGRISQQIVIDNPRHHGQEEE